MNHLELKNVFGSKIPNLLVLYSKGNELLSMKRMYTDYEYAGIVIFSSSIVASSLTFPVMDLCLLVVNNLPLNFEFGSNKDDIVVFFVCPINHSIHDVLNELVLVAAGRDYYGQYTLVDATGNPLCMYPNYTPVPLPKSADAVIGNSVSLQGGIGFIGICETPRIIELSEPADMCSVIREYIKERNGMYSTLSFVNIYICVPLFGCISSKSSIHIISIRIHVVKYSKHTSQVYNEFTNSKQRICIYSRKVGTLLKNSVAINTFIVY